jgi:hypothetical protein
MIDEERIEISENQLKEAKQMVEESDIKYDEVRAKFCVKQRRHLKASLCVRLLASWPWWRGTWRGQRRGLRRERAKLLIWKRNSGWSLKKSFPKNEHLVKGHFHKAGKDHIKTGCHLGPPTYFNIFLSLVKKGVGCQSLFS